MLNNVSIKNKLTIIILATSTIVLLVSSIIFVISELIIINKTIRSDLKVVAKIIAMDSAIGLNFEDTKVVKEALDNLKAKSNIEEAHVFNRKGENFASYYKHEPKKLKNKIQEYLTDDEIFEYNINNSIEKVKYEDKHIHLYEKINYSSIGADNLGTVYLKSNLDKVKERFILGLWVIILFIPFAMLSAFIMASKLQKIITSPIYSLLATMKKVSQQKNYTIRENKTTNDELGELVNGFNMMLSQIEERNYDLNEYKNNLETKVNIRTAELATARDQALEANKTKSIFLANMSHEIRTPMNAVLGYTQILLRDSKLSKTQQEHLNTIQNSGNHLLGLINDILDISKIEAGAMELNLENFKLKDLINSISLMFAMRCEQKGLNWQVKTNLDDNIILNADQGKLRQVLINLLGNAVKFTSHGDITLKITSMDIGEQTLKSLYLFEITDTGVGIPIEAQSHIFEPFKQDKEGIDKGGTGLGLAITKRQVELMNGTVGINSQNNKGSTFFMELILNDGELDEISKSEKKILRIKSGQKISALIVDDIKENREILSNMLKEIGVDTVLANNGEDALNKLENIQIDIIFSDIRMPKMDGIKFIEHVRIIPKLKALACIAISASSLDHENKKVIQAGYDSFVAKPFKFDAIYNCLSKYLDVKFEYEEEKETINDIDKKNKAIAKIDFKQIKLEKDLYLRLYDAAEYNELTELETLINELSKGNKQLANKFKALLSEYDIDGILEILEDISYVE
jgi:signal transduction histidine kinase/CheY-like chemotaxis protein